MEGIKREQFPILVNKIHLNTCSNGALPYVVKKAALQYIEDWDNYGAMSWNMEGKWNDQVELARKRFAKLIGAKSKNIAIMFGNSTAFSAIMNSFEFNKGEELVFNELDFPAVPTNIMSKSDHETEYKVARSKDGTTITVDDYDQVVGSNTKLISACEVMSNTGFRIPTDELIEYSHSKDIPIFLDTYQATGTIPMDVSKNDVDFLATGALKYLLGGFGMSFLYVRDDWIEKLLPGSIGWMGVDDPFADLYDKLRTKLVRPEDARKFQYGTPYPNGAYGAAAGLEMILDIGIEKIYRHNEQITQEIIDGAIELGYTTITPQNKDARGSIVNIQVENSHELASRMVSENFILDARAHGIRLSPHFYNNSEDVSHLLDFLSKIN